MLEREGSVCPRSVWYPPFLDNPALWVSNDEKSYQIYALWGLSPSDESFFGFALLPNGRWFTSEDFYSCIVGSSLAESLNIEVGDQISLNTIQLKVVGVLNDDPINGLVDLDAYPMLPYDYRTTFTAKKISNLRTDQYIIIPYSLATSLGANTFEIGVKLSDVNKTVEVASLISDILPYLDIYAGFQGNIWIFRHGVFTAFSALSSLIVPIILVAISFANVMMQNVYERRKEIAIYGSVGLSPTHIGGIFFAETIVYAIISSTVGYILAISIIAISSYFGLIGTVLFANFSSSFVLITLSGCILVTVVSALYPSILASRTVTPSLERRWTLPTSPIGDDWIVPLPFVGGDIEIEGILSFLKEFLSLHTTEESGIFICTCAPVISKRSEAERIIIELSLSLKLLPLAQNVEQSVSMTGVKEAEAVRWMLNLHIHRISGDTKRWETLNRSFIDSIRKQFLLWRTLPPSDKDKYQRLS